MAGRWYQCAIDRTALRGLMQRADRPALIWIGGFLALTIATGLLAFRMRGTAWAVPAFLLYGTVFAFAEAPAHELGHGTAFRTRWLNEAAYWVICFMTWREQVYSRWLHACHHSYTQVTVGAPADPEQQLPRPISLWKLATDFVRLSFAREFIGVLVSHSLGRPTRRARASVPSAEFPMMVHNARILLTAHLMVILWAVLARSWLPVLFLTLPRLYGAWLHELCALTQHAGLAENEYDHRLSCRTVRLNPLLRFLYWNMNYHTEHHMFPAVPFHALPRLRALVSAGMPPAYRGLLSAWREMLTIIRRQRRDPGYVLVPTLPEGVVR